jgi:HEAT repeat protein
MCSALSLMVAFSLLAAQAPEVTQDEQLLVAAGLSADGPALLEFFHARARLDTDREKLLALARQLGDPDSKARDRAAAELIGRGPVAVPALRHAVNDLNNPAAAERARKCLEAVEGKNAAGLPAAAARVVAAKKPAGAAAALLAYLPFADDETVVQEVSAALATLAFPDGKPEPVLLKALDDPVPVRRAVAGAALCRKEPPGPPPAVRALLQDPKTVVRQRVALALLERQDLDAVSVLIDLLGELSSDQRRPVEDALQQLAGEWAPTPPLQGDDAVSRRIRRDAWAGWWRNTDGPALLAEFRKRTLGPDDLARLLALLKALDADTPAARQKAAGELVTFGPFAVGLLREASKGAAGEKQRLLDEALRLIALKEPTPLPPAAARLVALRKPAGAAEALLAYLPFAEDEGMAVELQAALGVLAARDGKADPALVRALDDPLPARRTAAAEALSRVAGPDERPALRKLLRDADATVRLRVALALTSVKDKDAVPVLIDLLAELPAGQEWQAQEPLFLLAGDKAPKDAPGADAESRKKYRDAWAAWWKENEAKVDLAQLDAPTRLLGYTLLVLVNNNSVGRVVELGRDGKPRWQIDNLQYPVDAWMLGHNRVLVGEWNGRRVSERDLKGNILWEKNNLPGQVTNCQRLANGNTFIATDTGVLEVDRGGKVVFSHNVSLIAGYKSGNGVITCLTNDGRCLRLDASGKEIKSFPSGRGPSWTSGIDVLPNGNVLVSQTDQNRVAELNAEGKTVWQANAPGITTATRLPNGHTLVASHNMSSVTELDRSGKVVWEHKEQLHVFRARRR